MHDVTCEFRAQYECAQTISTNIFKGTASRLIYRVSKRINLLCCPAIKLQQQEQQQNSKRGESKEISTKKKKVSPEWQIRFLEILSQNQS